MKAEVSWRVELAVKPGQLDKLLALTREMLEFTRSEEGVLSYQQFVTMTAVKFMSTSVMRVRRQQ